MPLVFIGYDHRETAAFNLCLNSLVAHQPDTKAVALNHFDLRSLGCFKRPWTIEANGQFVDNVDGKPFSTEFSHSRFLVPHLSKESEETFAIFCDADFLFLEPISNVITEILTEGDWQDKSVFVVKQNFQSDKEVKMDNKVQTKYGKKLWSSFMVFNLKHPDVQNLTVDYVNSASGRDLHQFKWTSDDKIGALELKWNRVPDQDPLMDQDGRDFLRGAIHYTEGGPWFEVDPYEGSDHSKLWLQYYKISTGK